MTNIRWQYSNLYEEYLRFFKVHEINDISTKTLNKFDQIHAGGIKATEKILKNLIFKPCDKVLELGGGIGGVARLLKNKYEVQVINLDLSWDFSITGKKLTELCNDCKDISFINADATLCPFKDCSLDVVWLQHVNMNVKNKKQMFSEIKRVLKNNGLLIFHEWFLTGNNKEVTLPLPWADDASSNHLCTFDYFSELAKKHQFKTLLVEDETVASLNFYEKLIETRAFNNPIFKNRDGETIFKNIVKMLKNASLIVISGKMIKHNETFTSYCKSP